MSSSVSNSAARAWSTKRNPAASQTIVTTYSQLLALEPRLVFDAAIAATLDAVDEMKNAQDGGSVDHSQADGVPAVDAQSGQPAASQNPDLAAEEEAQKLLNSLASLPGGADPEPDPAASMDAGLITSGDMPKDGETPVLITGVHAGDEPENGETPLFVPQALTPRMGQAPAAPDAGSGAFMGVMAASDDLDPEPEPEPNPKITINEDAPWSETPVIIFNNGDEPFSVLEDRRLPLGGRIDVADPDTTEFKITLKVENGTLDLDWVPGLEGYDYDWADDRREVTFAGHITVLLDALATLSYTGDSYWNGIDTLTITLAEGLNGKGYNTVKATREIIVHPEPDPPNFGSLADYTAGSGDNELHPTSKNAIWEDVEANLRFNYGTSEEPDWKPLRMSDPDENDGEHFNDRYDLTLTVTHGVLSSTYDSGNGKTLSLDAGSEAPEGGLTYTLFNLTLDEVNGILEDLRFLGEQDYYGPALLTVKVDDMGKDGTGERPDPSFLEQSFAINVLPVNDAPTLKPAAKDDTANQLRVKETYPGDENPAKDGVGEYLTLAMFHANYNEADHQPDPESGIVALFDVDNTLPQLMVTITTYTEKGDLWLNIGSTWVKLAEGSTFSLQDVADGRVKYVHDPSLQVRENEAGVKFKDSTGDSFKFSVNDGAGATVSTTGEGEDERDLVMYITLLPVNQPPEVAVTADVVKYIPGARLDSTVWYNEETGQNETSYTIWGYEGEQGIPFAFDVIDPDQAEGADFTIRFTDLSETEGWGYFWYQAKEGGPYVKVAEGDEISLKRVQEGGLRFSHSGAEDKVGSMNFTISVTDDGGGEVGDDGKPVTRTTNADLTIIFRSHNDDPEWTGNAKTIWDAAAESGNIHSMPEVDGTRIVQIKNDVLSLKDPDPTSTSVNLTYTVDYDPTKGQLLYVVSSADNTYRRYAPGDKVSQADIDSGKIIWWFFGSGDVEADLTFEVRDGSLSAIPVPRDSEQAGGISWDDIVTGNYGESDTNWEKALLGESTPREGGIGKWEETSPGVYTWKPTTFTLHFSAINIPTGGTMEYERVVDPCPHFEFVNHIDVGGLNEGGMLQITEQMFRAWFTDGPKGAAISPTMEGEGGLEEPNPNADPAKLVYRIEDFTKHGWILYIKDGQVTYLSRYDSFTQQDIIDGYICYLHDSSERFSDSFTFSVSDGRNEATNEMTDLAGYNTKKFTFTFDMDPVNDTPETSEGTVLFVKEHDLDPGQSADSSTPGGVAHITTDHIRVSDRDGKGDKSGEQYFSELNDLYIVITELPESGTLYYNGVEITKALSGDALAAIKAGGGYATWDGDPNMEGIIVIPVSALKPGESLLTYQHNGQEEFSDGFKYIVSDDRGVNTTMVKGAGGIHDGGSVNSFEQLVKVVVTPVNDKPECVTKLDSDHPLYAADRDEVAVDEGGEIKLNRSNLHYYDPDGSDRAIQFIISELPKYGQLLLNGKVLGVGGVFTQDDINNGRVTYVHDDSENHQDSFKFNVSDSIYTSGKDNDDLPDEVRIDIKPINKPPTISMPGNMIVVDSLEGGVILNITLRDPDYGKFPSEEVSELEYYPYSGIVEGHDLMTVIIELSTMSDLDLNEINVFFKNNGVNLTITDKSPGNPVIILVGSYADLREALSEVTVKSGVNGDYDPDGMLTMKLTVYDGISDGAGGWKNPNGGYNDDSVYSASDKIDIYVSPVNTPPRIVNQQFVDEEQEQLNMHLTVGEDAPWTDVRDSAGKPIRIDDPDDFQRGGSSIALTVEHGTLKAAAIGGGSKIEGQGGKELIITGTLDQINTILASLEYKPDADYNGTDTLAFTYKDNANSGVVAENFVSPGTGYNQPYTYPTTSGKEGFAVNGEFRITISPVNDPPTLQAPDEIFLRSEHPLSGDDDLGKHIDIRVDDIDISVGGYHVDYISVTLEVLGVEDEDLGWIKGWLTLGALGDSIVPSGEVETSPGSELYTKITLSGALGDVNNAIKAMTYNRDVWTEGHTDFIQITVSDATADGASNGSPIIGSAADPVIKTIKIYCSNSNSAPTAVLPPEGWTVKEDAEGVLIFTGDETITITDADSFDKQVFVSISVDMGTLSLDKSLLGGISRFTSVGDPALQDRYHISIDGKTISFYAPLDKINEALQQIRYDAPPNDYNGQAEVTVYVNDLGMWGGNETQIESYAPVKNNPFTTRGMNTGPGLEYSATRTITITPINDAPRARVDNVNLSTASVNQVPEDSKGENNKTSLGAMSVQDLFGGDDVFDDSRDDQSQDGDAQGEQSTADSLAGIIIIGNAATAAQGEWQYSADGNEWTKIPTNADDGVDPLSATNALYLDKNTLIRFEPKEDFNGQPGQLTVLLVDDSDYDGKNNPANTALPILTGDDNGGILWNDHTEKNGLEPYVFKDEKIGLTTRFSKDSLTLSTYITPVNDAPVVATGKENVTLPAVDEDSTTHTGQTVSSLFTGSFDDSKDAVGAKAIAGGSSANGLAGVVITKNDAATGGVWQYRTGTTGEWTNIPTTLSDANALYLDAGAYIRFLPDQDWNGTPGSLTAHLVDNSAVDLVHNPANPALPGTLTNGGASWAGYSFSGSNIGGATRFSSGTVTLFTTINPVNDAPVVVDADKKPVNELALNLTSINEDPGYKGTDDASVGGTLVSDLFGDYFNDDRDNSANSTANGFAGVLVVGNDAKAGTHGIWQYFDTDDDTGGPNGTWKDIPELDASKGEVVALKADWSVRFNPALDFNGEPPVLTVRLIDSSVNTATNTVTTNPEPKYGVEGQSLTPAMQAAIEAPNGITRYSKGAITLGIFVEPVNDAPVAINIADRETPEDTPYSGKVKDIFSAGYNDDKDDQRNENNPNGSQAQDFEGVFIIGNAATVNQGVWEYSLDEGDTWIPVPTDDGGSPLGDDNALYLSRGADIRFVPADDYNGPVDELIFRVMEHYDKAMADYDSGDYYAIIDDDTDKTGGAEHISGNTATLTLTVTPVNDAPVDKDPSLGPIERSINEDFHGGVGKNGETVASLFGDRFDDSADNQTAYGGNNNENVFVGIIVQGLTVDATKGTWQFESAPGIWTALGNGMFISKDTKIRFEPYLDWNSPTPVELTVYMVENSGDFDDALPLDGAKPDFATGGESAVSSDTLTLKLTVQAVNDAPTIAPDPDNAGAFLDNVDVFLEANEDKRVMINDLFGPSFSDSKDNQIAKGGSSPDVFAGVFITSIDPGGGKWFYGDSEDTDNWEEITAAGVSEANPLYLSKDTWIRFVPDTNYNNFTAEVYSRSTSALTITVRLVETDNGFPPAYTNGDNSVDLRADAANSGGVTLISEGTVTAHYTVKGVNNAPVDADPDAGPIKMTIKEDFHGNVGAEGWTVGVGIGDLFENRFDDSADAQGDHGGSSANSFVGIIVEKDFLQDSDKGQWQYYDGGAWVPLDAKMFLGVDVKIRFEPAKDWNSETPVELRVHMVENSGDFAKALPKEVYPVTSFTSGGNSAVSADILTLQVTVEAVNDAPYWNDAALSFDNGQRYLLVDSIPPHAPETTRPFKIEDTLFLDAKDNVSGGSDADKFQGILIVGMDALGLGVWQYSIDGSTWEPFPADIGDGGKALFLPKDTLLRFQYDGTSPSDDAYPSLTVALVDSSGESNGLFDPANIVEGQPCTISDPAKQRGGVTAISAESVELRAVILAPPLNNPPVPQDDYLELDASKHSADKPAGGGGNLLANDKDDNPHDQLTVTGFTIDGADGEFGKEYELEYGKLVIYADGTYIYTLYGDGDDPDNAAATWDALAALPEGQSLVETADIRYAIKDSGRKIYVLGVAQYDDGDSLSAWARLSLGIMRPKNNSGNAPDPVVEPPQDSDPGTHLEDGKDYPNLGGVLKNLEVKKPVVMNVNSAQGAVFHSFAKGILDMQGASRAADKFLPGGSAEQALRVLHSEMGAFVLLAGKPAMAGLEIGKDNAVRLPASVFYCSDPKEKLSYAAMMANGDPLPSWLVFDASSLTFSGKPPVDGDKETMELVVIARSDSGHEARVKVVLRLHDPEKAEDAEQPAAAGQELSENSEENRNDGAENGPPGLSDQISGYGRAGILKTAQRLVQSLQLL